jgi:hypothetical protein
MGSLLIVGHWPFFALLAAVRIGLCPDLAQRLPCPGKPGLWGALFSVWPDTP